ncbi:MAG: HDIG domain-containing protein [Bacteroidaceae bacterium]|nr:HDIG domain-containing protein [Bacteroidaceae bacterium]
MSRYNHNRRFTARGNIYRALVSLSSIAILVFFMPRGNQMKIDFKKDNPWNYGQVIATENFPILKSEERLQLERDSLMQMYKPIFEMQAEVGKAKTEEFKKVFDQELINNVPRPYRKHIIEKLIHIYQTGIMQADDYERMKKERTTGIVLSVQNMGYTHTLKEIYTPKTAYEYLMEEKGGEEFSRSVLQRCNLNRFVTTNLVYDEERSKSQLENVEKQLVLYSGQVLAGQKIIDHGDIVDEKAYDVLRSWLAHQEGRQRSTMEKSSEIIGQLLYVTLLVVCLLIFFNQFRMDYLQCSRTVMLIALLTCCFPLITYALVKHSLLSVYIIPYCILPIFVRVFLDSRTAFITHLVSILLSAIAITASFQFVVVQIVAGLVAIYSLRQLSQRSELFVSVIQVTFFSMVCYLCFDLMSMNMNLERHIDYHPYVYILINGFLLLVSYLLLIPIERLFKFTSTVTLVELSNTNNEILRRLSEEAPGTFQHSMQVANLAAEVANALGGKSQLVRTAALYHDIGKLDAPVFYTENQNGVNPHDKLSYVKSAQIIISHVKKGLELAEKYRLPETIRDFIATHHGTNKAKYFYIKYKNEFPLLQVDENFFTYPGPNPSTMEQAILMMCDAVEAASRSLPEYTEENISKLVDRIVDGQVAEGFFNHCPITFEDIARAKQVLKNKLTTIYHTRISYPELTK